MPTARLRPSVLAAREKLADGRQKLQAQHDRGSPGIQVCARLTDLLDTVILDLYHDALRDEDPDLEELFTLTPNGGYGRRDVAPYSDVDLMLLHKPGTQARVATFVRRLTQDIVDAGMTLGFSVRTPRQACSLAMNDATIFTSLVESRFLAGSVSLFSRFMRQYRRAAARRAGALISRIQQSRREERRQHGDTVYLLKPNVKRSRGGLRDLQLLRWVAFARYGEADPDALVRAGLLPDEDRRKLRNAHEFLLRLRNELHFHAGKSQDLLDRHEQVRIAEVYQYEGDESLLPVERFMREYIEHASEIRYTVTNFVAAARSRKRWKRLLAELLSTKLDDDFIVIGDRIRATKRSLPRVANSVVEILRLMDLANRTDTRIEHKTWRAIREAMTDRPDLKISPAAAKRFLSLIDEPGNLADQLRRLHELRVLEKLIPAFAHARCLMQFNEYHKFTVDEHSIHAVECATRLQTEPGPLGDAYRGVKNKSLLHLALLSHDLGKGFVEDHSEVGARLAEETAAHLGLKDREAEQLRFLVHKHLLMSHLAQRRDIHDEKVLVELATEVGSVETLQMLYVLTCADLDAVGPGVLNGWKLDLQTQLYRHTRNHLSADATDHTGQMLSRLRADVAKRIDDADDPPWWKDQLALLPRAYLIDGGPDLIAKQLGEVRQLGADDAIAWGRYLPERNAVEYTVGAYETRIPGIFHRLTGVFTSKRLEILSAEIHTLARDLVLDRFYVSDADFPGEPPAERLDEITDALSRALTNRSDSAPSFSKTWSSAEQAEAPEQGRLPTQVRIDNSTSEKYTIVDVFAHDSPGLLYAVSRAIFELGLSVHGAKIGTYLDQVVDVFYVLDSAGRKIFSDERIEEIRQSLLAVIEEHETEVASA